MVGLVRFAEDGMVERILRVIYYRGKLVYWANLDGGAAAAAAEFRQVETRPSQFEGAWSLLDGGRGPMRGEGGTVENLL